MKLLKYILFNKLLLHTVSHNYMVVVGSNIKNH